MKRIPCHDMPGPTPDDAGDASFLGPSQAPTQKADTGSRQRPQKQQPKKNSPQASPETQMQQNTVNSSVLWPGSRARARARQKARKPTRQKQGPRSTRASHSKSKTERGPSIAGMPGSAWPKMSLAYIPPIPSTKQCFMGAEGFWKEVLMMQTKPRCSITQAHDDVSHMA